MDSDLNLRGTELRLGLPGTEDDDEAQPCTTVARGSKRTFQDTEDDAGADEGSNSASSGTHGSRSAAGPATKAQVVGWPPIAPYRRNSFHQQAGGKKDEIQETGTGMYVKVSMDGAPYLRKIDIKGYNGYPDLLKAMEGMFKFTIGEYSEREGYKGSEYVPAYEDKDGDWMLVGDVPWEMFISSCKKLRIMKGSEAKGLSCNM